MPFGSKMWARWVQIQCLVGKNSSIIREWASLKSKVDRLFSTRKTTGYLACSLSVRRTKYIARGILDELQTSGLNGVSNSASDYESIATARGIKSGTECVGFDKLIGIRNDYRVGSRGRK